MAEETTKKTTTRKTTTKKATTTKATSEAKVEATNTNDALAQQLAQMQAMMLEMQNRLAKAEEEKAKAEENNNTLNALVEALKSTNTTTNANSELPTYVKVVSLIPSVYNLSTLERGEGRIYQFTKAGDTKTVGIADLQAILSISKYREQCENGYFYIDNSDVCKYVQIENGMNLDTMTTIMELSDDSAVDKFANLDENLKDSVADYIAQKIAKGEKFDRNRIADIYDKTNVDIDSKARFYKKINERFGKSI